MKLRDMMNIRGMDLETLTFLDPETGYILEPDTDWLILGEPIYGFETALKHMENDRFTKIGEWVISLEDDVFVIWDDQGDKIGRLLLGNQLIKSKEWTLL